MLAAGVVLLVSFVAVEARTAEPMLPPSLFRSLQFSGSNAVTFAVYAGVGAATFLVVIDLQVGLGYSALQAGAALLPMTVLLLLLSARAGATAQRIGPTLPMTVGPLLAAVGLGWLSFLEPGDQYVTLVLPAVTVLGLGLCVSPSRPSTAVVLAAVDDAQLGVGSGVNNAVARLAGLLGIAVVPTLAGVDLNVTGGSGLPGFRAAAIICAGLCAIGGAVAVGTIRKAKAVRPTLHPSNLQPCLDPCRLEDARAA